MGLDVVLSADFFLYAKPERKKIQEYPHFCLVRMFCDVFFIKSSLLLLSIMEKALSYLIFIYVLSNIHFQQ